MSDTRPPKPIVPMPSLFASPMIDASSSASRGSGFTSSNVRNSCSLAAWYPDVRSPPMQTPIAPGAHPFPCAIQIGQLQRQRVLRVHVLAAAALQDQLDLDFVVVIPLLEVDDRCSRTDVVARVLAGDRVDGIGPQLPAPRRFGDGVADLLLHHDLVRAHGRLH